MNTLKTAEDFFVEVLRENHDIFFGRPSTLTGAANLASSLYLFHNWLYAERRGELEARFERTFPDAASFWKEVERVNPRFYFIRDVAVGSKHLAISSSDTPKGDEVHVANTYVTTPSGKERRWGVDDDGEHYSDAGSMVSFDNCAQDLFAFWIELMSTVPVASAR